MGRIVLNGAAVVDTTDAHQDRKGRERGSLFESLVRRWGRADAALYPIFAGACVLYAAMAFYTSMRKQTGGVWSAPLDDVFIHFDYARATARGYPFQWSEGNGFSSGNTSLSYPFVLALGYWVGFRELWLMQWAAMVACVSTFGFLITAGRLSEKLGPWAKYLIPPAVLSLGALDWSLWSGMENAFHLGMWALALSPALGISRAAAKGDEARVRRLGFLAGAAGALLFATRPESVVCVASFGLFAAFEVRRAFGMRASAATLLRIGVPGAIALVAQAVTNRVLTGEWSANGAIAKLAMNHPYMTAQAKLDEYLFNLRYVVLRNTQHHFADLIPWGWLVPAVALLPLASRRTRKAALLLWANVAGWLLLVAMNGQVRWQNERYTMSAVAWLFVLAALGLGVVLRGAIEGEEEGEKKRSRWAALGSRAGRVAAALALAGVYWVHQAPNMRDQMWFFGRASRNIHDQHVVAGRILGKLGARRVLVGDAGALLYASDIPGLDLIGLGGYHDYPFARAGTNGLGASLELIERMPAEERPDVMAIYPTWWGDLPTLFGKRLLSIPVVGNVICGGLEKVIYKADWRALDQTGRPRSLRHGEVVVDALDVADLMSEKAHSYAFPHPAMGFVIFRLLPDAADPRRDLFDAGRLIPHGQMESARMQAPRGRGRLVVRAASTHDAVVEVLADGKVIGKIAIPASKGWEEPWLDLPAGLPERFELGLRPVEGEWGNYHVWIVEGGEGAAVAGPPEG